MARAAIAEIEWNSRLPEVGFEFTVGWPRYRKTLRADFFRLADEHVGANVIFIRASARTRAGKTNKPKT